MPMEHGYRCPYCGDLIEFPPTVDMHNDLHCDKCHRCVPMGTALLGYLIASQHLGHVEMLAKVDEKMEDVKEVIRDGIKDVVDVMKEIEGKL